MTGNISGKDRVPASDRGLPREDTLLVIPLSTVLRAAFDDVTASTGAGSRRIAPDCRKFSSGIIRLRSSHPGMCERGLTHRKHFLMQSKADASSGTAAVTQTACQNLWGELDPYSLDIHQIRKYELSTLKLSKVIV